MMIWFKSFLCAFFLWVFALPTFAQQLLFDAAWINWFDRQALPILQSAELEPNTVEFRLINDDDINAFVTPDRGIYFNTGLILKADTAEEVVGVIAHEIAHIKGRHHLKLYQTGRQQMIPMIISGLAGIGAAAAGSGDAAAALLLGGQATSTANLFRASRGHENEADRTAFTLLNENGLSAQAFVDFMEQLNTQQLLYSRIPPAYLSTHPLTPERLSAARHHVNVREANLQLDRQLDVAEFEFLQARLRALTHSAASVLRFYHNRDDAPAQLARAIATARQGKLAEAEDLLTPLLQSRPQDPYLLELLAQLRLDHGQLTAATATLRQAVSLAPDDLILRYQLAVVERLAGEFQAALANLQTVRQSRPQWFGPARQLGLVYGALGERALSHLWLAQAALEGRDELTARTQVALAEQYITTTDHPHAADLAAVKRAVEEM